MLAHLFNLLSHSAALAPSRISSNWGGVWFSAAAFVLVELLIWKFGDMNGRWTRNILLGFAGVTLAWVGLFEVSVVLTIYDDHQNLVGVAHRLRKEVDQKQVELDKKAKPILVGKLAQIITGPAGQHDEDVVITVLGTVTNTGAPTVLLDWSEKVRFSDGKVIVGQWLVMPPEKLDLSFSHTEPSVSLSMKNFWPRIADSNPVVTGGAANGWITARFYGLTQKQIGEDKPTVVVACADITGTPLSIEERIVSQGKLPPDVYHVQKH